MRLSEQYKTEINSTVMDRLDRRFNLFCSFCKPNRVENRRKRTPKDDRYKNKRRKKSEVRRQIP